MKFFILSKRLSEKILFLVALIYLVGFNQVKAQSTFYNDYLQQQSYYDSLILIRGVDSMQGTGCTQYKRWFRYWAPKLLPDRDYDDYQQALLEYANNYTPPPGSMQTGTPSWRLIGPNDMPVGGSNGRGTGQIHYIYFDPHDLTKSTLFACSPVGGLFRSTNGGNNWVNAGTDKGLPMSGVSSVVVDSRNPNTWYVTTGNGESFSNDLIWQLSIGLFKTSDAGATWEEIPTPYHRNMRKVIEVLPANSNTTLLVTTTHGLLRIDNANTSTTSDTVLQEGQFYDVELDINDSTIAYASGSDTTGVYKINLITNSVVRILAPDTLLNLDSLADKTIRRLSLEMSPAAKGILYAINSIKDGNRSYLYRYDIENEKWVSKGHISNDMNGYARKMGWSIRKKFHNGLLDVFGQDAWTIHVYKDSLNDINVDTSNCHQYSDREGINIHDDFHYLFLEENDSIIWAGTDGGVYKGTFVNDTAISWEVKNTGLGVATVEHIDAYLKENKEGYMVTSGQFDCGSNLYLSQNGADWSCDHKVGGDGYQTVIVNTDHYFMGKQHNINEEYYGTNDDLEPGSYIKKDTSCNDLGEEEFYANWDVYYDYHDSKVYMAGSKDIRKYDNGTWYKWSSFSDNSHPDMGCGKSGTWFVLTTGNANNTMYCSTFGSSDPGLGFYRIYKSQGGGTGVNTWKMVQNQAENRWITDFDTGANSENTLYVCQQESVYEVDVSDPDSASWANITYNMETPSFNSLRYDHAGGLLWAGVSPGIYYLTIGDTVWHNYATNLPNVEVTDIEIIDDKIFVGTYGRGVWYASAPGCFVSGTPDTIKPNEQISSGLVKTVKSDIFVPSGVTYKIYGTLKMGADCRIIVERGATLIVDGGKITNACPDMWSGIEVWGFPGQIIDSTKQGWAIFKDSAIVEHAERGVYTFKLENGFALADFSGGIIQAENSTFRNNKISVHILNAPDEYTIFSKSLSRFTDCHFLTDSSYYFFDPEPQYQVSLAQTSKVILTGNTFENSCSLAFASEENRGVGISSFNSSFFAGPHIQTGATNTFVGLEYGIKIYDYMLSNVTVDSCFFNHNKTGIYASGNTFGSFNRNEFKIIPLDQTYYSKANYSGIYLDYCTGYSVQENIFSSEYDTLTHGSLNYTPWGTYINNSGIENNMLYKNEFHNLYYATMAANINRSASGNTGLQIKCNEYWENYSDINVLYEGSEQMKAEHGIALFQGGASLYDSTYPGNQFSHVDYYIYSDFENNANKIYYCLPNNELQQAYRIKPKDTTNLTIDFAFGFPPIEWKPERGCPSMLSSRSGSELRSIINNSELLASLYSDSLDILVDAGNTSILNLDVQTAGNNETMEVRQELLDASPYLSDTVMASAIAKEEVLPNAIITEVLVANPQSAKSDELLDKLYERDNPPTDSQKALIMANDTTQSHKEKLENNYAIALSNKHLTITRILRNYQNELRGETYIDSANQIYNKLTSPFGNYQKAWLKLVEKDSTGVLEDLSDIPFEVEMTDFQSIEYDAYCDLFDLFLELQANEKQLFELSESDLSLLYDIVDQAKGRPVALARNLLIHLDSLEYEEPYIFSEHTDKSREIPGFTWEGQELKEENEYFMLYPNPAHAYFTLEYAINIPGVSAAFVVTDLKGVTKLSFEVPTKAGIKTIDLTSWKPGTYLVSLKWDGIIVQTKKFTVN